MEAKLNSFQATVLLLVSEFLVCQSMAVLVPRQPGNAEMLLHHSASTCWFASTSDGAILWGTGIHHFIFRHFISTTEVWLVLWPVSPGIDVTCTAGQVTWSGQHAQLSWCAFVLPIACIARNLNVAACLKNSFPLIKPTCLCMQPDTYFWSVGCMHGIWKLSSGVMCSNPSKQHNDF